MGDTYVTDTYVTPRDGVINWKLELFECLRSFPLHFTLGNA